MDKWINEDNFESLNNADFPHLFTLANYTSVMVCILSLQMDSHRQLISFEEFKRFLVDNNVLAIAAGLAFGQATLQLIKSFVADVVLPLVYTVAVGTFRLARPCALPSFESGARPSNFAAEVITYILIIMSAFVLINNIFQDIILKGVRPDPTKVHPEVPMDIPEGFDSVPEATPRYDWM